MRNDQLWIANAGDSRAVLAVSTGDAKLKAVDLSVDQNPNSPAEQVGQTRCYCVHVCFITVAMQRFDPDYKPSQRLFD